MDFSLTEEQEAVRDLARQIFDDRVTHERLLELEKSGAWFDDELWRSLAEANLTALALPEDVGGGGFGMLELCLVLEEQGRHVAPVPLLATVVAAGAIAEFGTREQRERWLRPVADAAGVLSSALVETGVARADAPRTRAVRDGAGWRLDGEKQCVPAAERAGAILVPARTDDGVGVFVVEPGGEGTALEAQVATHREPQARLVLDAAPAERLGGDAADGAAAAAWLALRTALGLAAIQLGVAEAATRHTAAYVSERKQFGRPIGTFQGVVLRIADAWIDVEALRGVVLQAAWRVSEGRPAAAEIGAAKWWAACAGHRVVHTAQHLHGGIGSDVEYPIHRFFLWAKQNELLLGGENQQLAELGARLVDAASAGAAA